MKHEQFEILYSNFGLIPFRTYEICFEIKLIKYSFFSYCCIYRYGVIECSLQSHWSLLPHRGQLQLQSSNGVVHVGHCVYSA